MVKKTVKDILSSMRQLAFDFFEDEPKPKPQKTEEKDKTPSHDTSHGEGFTLTPAFSYRLERSKRKTVGFIVDESGLTIRAPHWVSVAEIEKMIQEKEDWIQKKLTQFSQWSQKTGSDKIRFVDGAVLPYLGTNLQIKLGSESTSPLEATAEGFILHVNLPHDADEKRVRDWVEVWFKKAALTYMDERIKVLAARVGVSYRRWGLSSARGRWGSCSSDRRIRLNWRLIHLKPAVIDYVIAHELAHLSEMNHSARFWERVGQIEPNYESSKRELKSVYIPTLPFEG